MKNKTTTHLQRAVLAVPMAALMLGAAEASSTVGLNFQSWYYDSGNNPQTIGFNNGYSDYATTGLPVTAMAFGVDLPNWNNTNPIGAGSAVNLPCTFGNALSTTFAGGLSCNVTAPKGAYFSGAGELQSLASQYNYPTPYAPGMWVVPGDHEVSWGVITADDANPFSVSVTGLAAKFPDGYVIQSIAALGENGGTQFPLLPSVDFTDGVTTSTSTYQIKYVMNNPGAQWTVSTVGISTPSAAFTADTIQINSRADGTGIKSTLAGFIITDKPVITSCTPAVTSIASGGSFTLNSTSAGLGTLTYQWKRNGTNIGTNSQTLTVSSASPGDSGAYTLTVSSNLYPSEPAISQSVAVTVAAPVAVTWDANTGTAGAQDGNGTWNANNTNWWNGATDQAWSAINPATFGNGGTGNYTVTLGSNLSTSTGLNFNSGIYTISPAAAETLTLSGTATIHSQADAVIDTIITGTNGLTKTGAGTLSLTRQSTYSGGTVVNNGKLVMVNSGPGVTRFSGALTVNSGATVETNNGDSNGLGWQNQITSVAINGGLINFTTNGHAWNITGGITMTGGTFQSNNGVNLAGNAGGDTQIEWNKTSVTTLASASTSTIAGRIRIRTDGGYTGIEFNVADGAAATDLLVSAGIGENGSGMGITKNGAGLMALGNTNTFSGATKVNEGTLDVRGRIANTNSISLLDNASLKVTAAGGVPAISCTGTMTVGTDYLNPAGTNTITFSSLSSATVAPMSVDTLLLDSPVVINIASVTPVVGQYPLMAFSANSSIYNVTLGTLPAGVTATLVDDTAGASKSIYLDVTAVTVPSLLWTGATNNAWDINNTNNWTNVGNPASYLEGNVTTFDDSAPNTNVTLNTTVIPSVVTFNHSLYDYYLDGTGAIAGATSLTKSGTGILTISTANTYTGPTTINSGKVILLDAGASPLSGGILNNSILEIKTTASPVTFNSAITGSGTFIKSGVNTLTITGGMTLTTTTTVDDGTLEIQTRSSDAPYVVYPGTTLKLGYSTGGGYANTNLKLSGDGVAATTGLYLKGGTTYNVSGNMELLYAATTIRQYGSGYANIGIFDINSTGLICTAAASGSATDANIKFVSYGYGMSVNIESGTENATGDFTLNGPLDVDHTGNGFYKRGSGSLRLNAPATANNRNVRVQEGKIICGAAQCLGINSTLHINASALVDPNSLTQNVQKLYFGTVQQGAGTWGASGSGASHIDDTHFTGSGFVTVLEGPYTTWATANASGQAAGLDHDNDGVANGIEYFMGQTGTTFTPNPAIVAGVVSWPKGATYAGVYGSDYVVQSSTDLITWTDIPVGDLTSNANPLQYTLPTTGPKLFVRLKVTGP